MLSFERATQLSAWTFIQYKHIVSDPIFRIVPPRSSPTPRLPQVNPNQIQPQTQSHETKSYPQNIHQIQSNPMRSKSTQISSNLNPPKIKKHQHQTSKNSLKIKITITTNQRKSIKIKSKPTHPNPTQSTSKPNHQNRHQHQNKHQNQSNGIKTPSRPIPSRRQRLYSIAAKRFGIVT